MTILPLAMVSRMVIYLLINKTQKGYNVDIIYNLIRLVRYLYIKSFSNIYGPIKPYHAELKMLPWFATDVPLQVKARVTVKQCPRSINPDTDPRLFIWIFRHHK